MVRQRLSPPYDWIASILCCACSIVMLYFSMPPFGIWPFLLLGFSPMILAQYRLLPRRISALAPAVAISFFIFLYIAGTYGEILWKVPALWAVLPAVILIVFMSESNSRIFHERTGYRFFVLEGAVAWVGFEMIRSLIPFIGTGGFVGYAFYRAPFLIQPVSIVGMLGLDLICMLIAYALGLGLIALYDRIRKNPGPVPGQIANRSLGVVGILALVWISLSLGLYAVPNPLPALTAAAVQPGRPGDFALNARLSRIAGAKNAQLIVWPEGALYTDPRANPDQLPVLARQTGAYLVTGVGIRTSSGLRNEAVSFSPTGEFLGVYAKDHPLSLLGETSLTRGTYPVYHTPLADFATIICFDLEFSDTTRKMAAQGARLIAVPSSDWPELADRQPAYVIFRAVENRVAMVKADMAYDSLLIDAKGRILVSHTSSVPEQSVLVREIQPGPGGAPYTFLGDFVGWICLGGMVVVMVGNPIILRRARNL